MDYLIGLFSEFTTNETALRWGLTAVITLLIFSIGMGIMFFIAGASDPVRKRLNRITQTGEEKTTGPTGAERIAGSLRGVSDYLLPKSEKESSNIQAQLIQAGFRSQSAILLFYGIKTLLAIVLPVLVLSVTYTMPSVSAKTMLYGALIATAIGVFAPNMVVDNIRSKRQTSLRRAFPDALDLLVVCIEAGLSFDMAFRKLSEDMEASHPLMAHELGLINSEIRAGVPRVDALRNFAFRTGMDDIKGFVALISQSMRFGTSLAETLRVYSDDYRDKRMQAAEEKAAKLGTKLIFPLVLCFFPSLFVVAVGPAVIKALEVLGR